MSALTERLWAWWRLDEPGGRRLDASGNGRHLEDNGGVGAVPAALGAGAVFAGTPGQFLSLAGALPPGSFTVALWAQLLNVAAAPSLWAQGAGGQSLQRLFAVASNWRFAVEDAAGVFAPHGPLPAPWRHVAGVYDADAGRVTLFLDGQERGHLDGEDMTPGAAALALGSGPDGSAENFRGTLALCGLWTRALEAGEVAALFGGGAGADYPFGG